MSRDVYDQPKLQARKDWCSGLQHPDDNPYPPECDAHTQWEAERQAIDNAVLPIGDAA